MARTTHAQSESRGPGRRIDVEAIIAELLRDEDDTDELALDEHTLCRLIETQGKIDRDPELGAFA